LTSPGHHHIGAQAARRLVKKVAQVLAEVLRDSGIDRVFGIPGGENVEVVEALRQAGICFILTHHESSAVFMADATSRLTGKTSACLTTLGPGAANSVAGVAHAFLDRAPVLVITAQLPDDLIHRQPHQFVDLAALFAPVTKASLKLAPEGAAGTVLRALELTRSGRPGPVHLQVSNKAAGEFASASRETTSLATGSHIPRSKMADEFAAVHKLIEHCRRPAIVAGLGLEPAAETSSPIERSSTVLRRLAETAGAPVISTPKAKGVLPEDHPLAGGTIGLTRFDPAYKILDEADCILAVGFDAVELVKPWDQTAPLVWIAQWENLDPALPADAEFVGPMSPILIQMSSANWSAAPDWGERRVQSLRDELQHAPLPAPAPGRLLPQSVLQALRRAAPRDALVTTDVGSHKILTCLTWPTYTPNSFLVSNGLSCMGFGLPAAIAASLIDPPHRVICITGDAGLAMALGELGVLARSRASVLVVVLNDGALDLIRSQQLRAGNQAYGTEFENPDFVRIGQAYGIRSCRVSDPEQLQRELEFAFAAPGPALLEAMIDPAGYSAAPKNESTLSDSLHRG
jgi:acetolactate synthase I/II/III large subunit